MYNTQGTSAKSSITNIISYNSSGKTVLLKYIARKKKRIDEKNVDILSTSQKKKKKIFEKKKQIWIIDEPYTLLDIHNYVLIKQVFKEHLNKKGVVYYTYNIKKIKKKHTMFFFYSHLWI